MKTTRVIVDAGTQGFPTSSQQILSLISPAVCHHCDDRLRIPLGIYNVSISRICRKFIKLAQLIERYFVASTDVETVRLHLGALAEEVIDYVELTLYATAEHVDDLTAIGEGFFKPKKSKDRNDAFRQYEKAVKEAKKFVATTANQIKHQQSRIRPYTIEYTHADSKGCLHGYFFEGVVNGVVGPNRIIHTSQEVFSLTTLLWEVIAFLVQADRAIVQFITKLFGRIEGPAPHLTSNVGEAVAAAARLPLYTFGEQHPFDKIEITLHSPSQSSFPLDSRLYGSILHPWATNETHQFGAPMMSFQGDHVTRQFTLAVVKEVALKQWNASPQHTELDLVTLRSSK